LIACFTLVGVLLATASSSIRAQAEAPSLVRLFKLEGASGEELPAKIRSAARSKNPGFTLAAARLEADNMGVVARIRTVLTIANDDPARRITGVEWRLDIFDASHRYGSSRIPQSDKVNIYSGERAVASARFGAVLPDRMVVLFQLVSVTFADDSVWSSTEECSLEEDLVTVSCKSR